MQAGLACGNAPTLTVRTHTADAGREVLGKAPRSPGVTEKRALATRLGAAIVVRHASTPARLAAVLMFAGQAAVE